MPTKKGQSCQGEKGWEVLRGSQTLARPLSAKKFWGEATRLGARYRFEEWVKLAELVMVMVPGSVKDERIQHPQVHP